MLFRSLAGAVVLAILAIGIVAGWPLMVAAVGVERGDSFQAISTAFSYLYQRPLHYAFYAVVAAVVAVPALAAATKPATDSPRGSPSSSAPRGRGVVLVTVRERKSISTTPSE